MRKMSEKHAGDVYDFVTYLLRDHIYCRQTMLVEELIRKTFLSYYEGGQKDIFSNVKFETYSNGSFCGSSYRDELSKVKEWWLITPILGELLKKSGEIVADSQYGTWWGRHWKGSTFSPIRSLYDDEVFRKIYQLKSIKLHKRGKKHE